MVHARASPISTLGYANMSDETLYIGGRWIDGYGRVIETRNPASGEAAWRGAGADADQVDAAITAARRAFPQWCQRTLDERIAHLHAFADALDDHREMLANTIALETGKPLWESRTEVAAMIGKIDISVRAYRERAGTSETRASGGCSRLTHKPHGVLAVFGPYNFPGHLPNGHIVPALLAGNAVVFKPSEFTPQTAALTVRLWAASGLDHGEINLLQGGADTGSALAAHAGIDGVLFTGSARTGHALHQQLGGQPEKILALEMGGNNPLVVAPVADIDAAVYIILLSAYLSAGQRCTCARRLYLPEGEFGDRLLARLIHAVRQVRVGRPDDPEPPFMGPVISAAAAERVLAAQRDLLARGGRPLVEVAHLQAGTGLITPGLIDVNAATALPDDEIFGPLLQVARYRGLDDAIERANATRYGLAAGLVSDDPADFETFHRRIRAGIVNWNKPTTGASSAAPFGGIGISGNHRPSAYYATDYCAYPVASMLADTPALPDKLNPGIAL